MNSLEKLSIIFSNLCSSAFLEPQNMGWDIVGVDMVGSTYINDELTNDVDFVVVVSKENASIFNLYFTDWEIGGSIPTSPAKVDWSSWKRTFDGVTYNMIVTDNLKYAQRWVVAAEVCKLLENVRKIKLTKEERCGIHSVIMDDNRAEEAISAKVNKVKIGYSLPDLLCDTECQQVNRF